MKPAVTVLVGHYLPGMKAGGPIRSIANLVEGLGDEIDFRVVTRDRDLGDATPYPGIFSDRWTAAGKAQVRYLPPEHLEPFSLARILSETGSAVIYLNSFFSWEFSILPMFLVMLGWVRSASARPKRVVLAPRGEFSPGALGLKRWRKRAFLALARCLPVYRQAVWHASSAYEERDIRALFGPSVEVRLALPISVLSVPARGTRAVKEPGKLRLICLSRVSPKKNLLGALRMLEGVAGEIEFNVYGPAEDPDYLRECRAVIGRLPRNVRVGLHAAVPHEEVAALFASHHLFYFPTLGENYGHVISEALTSGCPALLSDQTPWRGLAQKGAGWDLPLDSPEKFRTALERAVAMDEKEFAAASEAARRFARDFAAADEQVARSREIFLGAAA
jgi:glycosyltransferase involved in cell wall biosynthesis